MSTAITDAIAYLERRRADIDRLIGELHLFLGVGEIAARTVPEDASARRRVAVRREGRPSPPVVSPTERRQLVLSALTVGPKKLSQLCEESGVDRMPMRWTMMRLRDDKLIRAVGGGKAATWTLIDPPENGHGADAP